MPCALPKAIYEATGTAALGGGPESFDYFVVTPFESFTAMDVERDGVMTVVEKQSEKKKETSYRKTSGDQLKNPGPIYTPG